MAKKNALTNTNNTFIPISEDKLHGRRRIYTNEEEITRENVLAVLSDALQIHALNREEEVYLEKYVRGLQPISMRQKAYNSEINNKICVNMANQIVTFKAAEFAGKPIQYVSRGADRTVPEKLEKLNSMMISEGKPSKDFLLAKNMFTMGVGYRLVLRDKALAVARKELLDEAPFEIYIPDPRNTFVIRLNHVSGRKVAGVTYVYLDDKNVQYTVYTPDVTFVIEGRVGKAEKIVDAVTHNNGVVPLIEYPCNSEYMSPIEIVHDLINAMSLTQSNRLDGIEQFIQALMVFDGVDISRKDFLELKDLGAIKLPPSPEGMGSSGKKLYYLNEQLDQSQTQTLVDDMKQQILEIVGMPSQGNANTSDSSNNGAIIMKNGWWNAESRRLETAGMWADAETEFLKIALKFCGDANVMKLKVSDVETKFLSNSYENLLVKSQTFTTMIDAGCPPIQAYTASGIVSDPEAAAIQYEEYRKEQEVRQESAVVNELEHERERIRQNEDARSVSGSGPLSGETDEEGAEEAE